MQTIKINNMKLAEKRARQLIEKLEPKRSLQDSNLYVSIDESWKDGYAAIHLLDRNDVYVAILFVGEDIEIPGINECEKLEDLVMSFGWTGRLNYMEGEVKSITINM